ncbi:MAG: ABC transporter permease [Colwellia sp.]|nr:ABC transporter permease [Colwellia sp.]
MNLFLYQLKQALLSLKKKPGFVFSVVTTMGITLGALLCILTLNHLLLVEPLPYPEQDRLFVAEHGFVDSTNNNDGFSFTYPGLVHLYKSKDAFDQAAMILHGQDVIISKNNQPLVNTAYVTPEFHQLLASPLALGRMFEATEALDTYNPVAMLSYKTWQQEFTGSVNILEQKINLSGVSYRIIGVLAEGFFEPELAEIGRETHVWLPWDYNQTGERYRKRFGNSNRRLKFIGQLKEGVSQSQAQQILTPLVNNRWQEGVADIEFFKGWSIEMRVRSVKDVILGGSKSIAIMLLAGVLGLILIACANISNLFMSRTAEKRHQMAILAAIGATKKHLFKTMFAETSLLMFMSLILALVLAKVGFYIMQQYLGAILPRVSELFLTPMTFGFVVLITVILALFFAKLSTRMINYRTLNTRLQSSGKGSGSQVSKKIRHVLIVSQVALATVLVFANFSLLKGAVKTINAPIGFATNNISTLVLNFSSTDNPSQKEAISIMAEIMEKIEALPQVKSISQSSTPLGGFGLLTVTNLTDNEKYTPHSKWVDHQYFNMIEQPLLQGENFSVLDRRERINVMIVNQAFAKRLKADGNVLGMQVSTGRPEPFNIIGVVKDITLPSDTVKDRKSADIPRAYRANSLSTETFMLKLKLGQSVSREQLGKLLAEVDSRYSVFSFTSADDMLTQSLFTEITTAVTTATLALITFFLAGIGLYGILSYSTQIRRFELGTHMAVGAKRGDLIKLIIKDNARAILFGMLFSIGMLLLLTFAFSEQVNHYLTLQLLPVFIVTLAMISMLSFFACYLPLRQYINNPVIHALKGNA